MMVASCMKRSFARTSVRRLSDMRLMATRRIRFESKPS
jgi:hypothetical protein